MLKINKNSGFTLIEMLIAISIFAIIALAGNSALINFSKYNKIVASKVEDLKELQVILRFLDRDFSQVFNGEIKFESNKISINSWQNDKLTEIIYKFNSKNITRTQDKFELTLIDDISKVSVRALNEKNKWLKKWKKNNSGYLKALEVKFDSKFGEIIKQVLIDE